MLQEYKGCLSLSDFFSNSWIIQVAILQTQAGCPADLHEAINRLRVVRGSG